MSPPVLPPAFLPFCMVAWLAGPGQVATPGAEGPSLSPDTIPVGPLPAAPAAKDTVPAAARIPDLPVLDSLMRATLRVRVPAPGEGGPVRPATPDTIPPVQLEEVVVDILRSPVSMDQMPFAVSILGDELRTTGRSGASIEEALHGLPGVQVQNRFNDAVGERITVRGFGARSPFGVRGVKIVVDGIPATLPDGQSTLDHLDLGTLGRVEALRGPGSALYGNAAGGVLLFETRPPADSPFRQEVERVDGDHGLRRLQSTTSGTVGGGGYLLSLARYRFDGFRLDPGDASGGTYGSADREQANLQVSGPFLGGRFRLSGNAVERDAENPGSLDRELMLLGNRQAHPTNIFRETGRTIRQGQLGVGWEGPAGERELDLMGYVLGREVDNSTLSHIVRLSRSVVGARGIVRSEHVGEEGRVWWALGAEWDLQVDDRWESRAEGDGSAAPVLDQGESVLGGGVFIQALLPINRVLDLLTGLRYDRIRFRANDRLAEAGGRPDGSGVRTLDSASPSFGLHLDLAPALKTFVNLSTAFETPTTDELAKRPDGAGGFNPELEPQVGITGEVGGRGIVGAFLAYEITYFHTTLHGELVPFAVAEEPGRQFFRNAGRSIREGVEVALQFSPSVYWSLRATYATNTARFRDYEVDGVNYGGNRVPGLAPRRAEAILRVGPGSWFLELRQEATTAIPGNDANEPGSYSPSYALTDLRVGANEVNLLGVRISPFAGVTNLFDEYFNTSVVANAVDERYFEPGPGRNLYVGGKIAVQR